MHEPGQRVELERVPALQDAGHEELDAVAAGHDQEVDQGQQEHPRVAQRGAESAILWLAGRASFSRSSSASERVTLLRGEPARLAAAGRSA